MFSFFRTAEVIKFADYVVAEYYRLQRSIAVRHDSASKRLRKFEKLSQEVDAHVREQKLNFYKKSKMLYAIKQGLEQKGVLPSDVADFLNNLLIKGLKRKS